MPLSDEAINILQALQGLDLNYAFLRPRGKLSDASIHHLLNGKDATVHGCRNWCAEYAYATRELAEVALSHTLHGFERGYFRSDLFDRRQELIDA